VLILDRLLSGLKDACAAFPDKRKGEGVYTMADIGVSAFSLFFMQSESFLSYQRSLEEGHKTSNCQTLFGMAKIPTDNHIRSMLDPVHPRHLQGCFDAAVAVLRDNGGLKTFLRLGERTLIALDGTEYFCSQKLGCPHCQTRKRANGKTEFYHAMLAATLVAPGHNMVLPLMPEFIVRPDGAEKQDCERNAVKRWLEKHGARLKPLRPVYLADDLFACQSVVERLADNGDDFIFTCKETSHKALCDFIDGCEFERHEVGVRKGKTRETHRYRFVEKVPLRDGKDAVLVNWIGFEILDAKGAVKYKTAFVTSLPVTRANVAEIVACGRARWKIENESFNVLKNHGYELEHNFGHGEEYLAMTLAALNMLAFAWHTVLDLLEPQWRKARQAAEKRTTFFAYLATLTSFVVFPAWSDLFEALTTFTIPPHLLAAPKIE